MHVGLGSTHYWPNAHLGASVHVRLPALLRQLPMAQTQTQTQTLRMRLSLSAQCAHPGQPGALCALLSAILKDWSPWAHKLQTAAQLTHPGVIPPRGKVPPAMLAGEASASNELPGVSSMAVQPSAGHSSAFRCQACSKEMAQISQP